MGVHGSSGAGSAGTPPLPMLRMPAIVCCSDASPMRDADEQQRQAPQPPKRRPVRGGGPATGAHHHRHHVHGERLETALRHQCLPMMGQPALPGIRGGGPAAAPVLDPTVTALVGLLGQATPPEARPSLLRQLGDQLASLLAVAGERIAVLVPARDPDATMPLRQDLPVQPGRADAAIPAQPLQPPPPPIGPTLTLDPVLGTIIDPGAEHGDGAGGTPATPDLRDEDGAADHGPEIGMPSAWLPIAGMFSRPAIAARMRGLVDRIDALLDETGITRLQLLLLVVLAPLATAFLIDVVASILAGR